MPSFTPGTEPAAGSYTAVDSEELRNLLYADEPILDGSLTYGDLIAADGFFEAGSEAAASSITGDTEPVSIAFTAGSEPATGSFTPAS